MKALLACVACVLVCGCNTLTHFNLPYDFDFQVDRTDPNVIYRPPSAQQVRATTQVDGRRGNPRVLFFLAMSGGGSRAAYFSGETMLQMQKAFPGKDLLAEVDVMSSVSGGSLAAAYYAVSRDEQLTFGGLLRQSVPTITAPVRSNERLRLWNETTVRDLMTRDYLIRSTLNWFWPSNFFAYWLTSYDRSDIMAKTLEDNLYDTPILGETLTFADLNPQRPYLILNATSATEQSKPDDYSFGSVFAFTQDDFVDRLNSEIRDFPVARAVQASAAFPAVYANVSLRDFRPYEEPECKDGYANRQDDLCDPRYLHVFDGGNSDNLGLRSIKRALLDLETKRQLGEYDKVVVFLIDAFTRPKGAKRSDFDPRSAFGRLIDPNVLDAVDSLLQANRASLLTEFRGGIFSWSGDCGLASVRHLPAALCDRLREKRDGETLDLTDKLVFYHFSFESASAALKRKLDLIPTSFSIDDDDVTAIRKLVETVITDQNPCLSALHAIVLDSKTAIHRARAACGNGRTLLQHARGEAPEQAPVDVDTVSKSRPEP